MPRVWANKFCTLPNMLVQLVEKDKEILTRIYSIYKEKGIEILEVMSGVFKGWNLVEMCNPDYNCLILSLIIESRFFNIPICNMNVSILVKMRGHSASEDGPFGNGAFFSIFSHFSQFLDKNA